MDDRRDPPGGGGQRRRLGRRGTSQLVRRLLTQQAAVADPEAVAVEDQPLAPHLVALAADPPPAHDGAVQPDDDVHVEAPLSPPPPPVHELAADPPAPVGMCLNT